MVNWLIEKPDPILQSKREVANTSSLVLKLFIEVLESAHDISKDDRSCQSACIPSGPLDVKMRFGSINDHWEPTFYQLLTYQYLHRFTSLHHSLVNLTENEDDFTTKDSTENDLENTTRNYLKDYSVAKIGEIKVWFHRAVGDVVLYFPATIQLRIQDLYYGIGGHTLEENGFATYVRAAANRIYDEFLAWFKKKGNFSIHSLKIYGHSRGAAVADLFLFLGKDTIFESAKDDISIVRGSPLPSLGRANEFLFKNVNIVNVTLIGDDCRDPYTKVRRGFYHPSGYDIFLKVNGQ